MILVSSFLDLIGISTIVPIVSLLSAPSTEEAIQDNALLRLLSIIFNTTDTTKLSVIALVSIIFIYIIKTLYAFLMTYVTNKFTMTFNRNLRARLMQVFLAMPYEYHHENNSSTLIRKSTYDVDTFCNAVNGFLSFLVKTTTSLTIIVYLFISSWIVTLTTGFILLIFAFLTIFILKNKNRRIGKQIQQLNSFNYQYLSQSFNGIKESKICNNEDFFINQYVKNVTNINNLSLRRKMYSSIPGHSIEFMGMLGIVLSLLIIIGIGNTDRYQIISTFAIFAYAIIKLLPCVIEMTSYVNDFSFYSSSVETIHNDLNDISQLEKQIEKNDMHQTLAFSDSIRIENVSFSYRDNMSSKILKNISFTIKKNTSVAISGVSGAGKTTLVDIILGLLKPTSGNVYCDNENINDNLRGWRDNLSYVPQNIFLIDDSIKNNVAFGIDKNKVEEDKVWKALEKAQLSDFVKQSPNGLDTVIGERGIRLSGGQRQRIGIARAFYRDSNVIVLDEATSALDYETEKNILDHVISFSKDHTLIIITHRLNTIDTCDHIYKIENGEVTDVK